jgi:hypothetical protein
MTAASRRSGALRGAAIAAAAVLALGAASVFIHYQLIERSGEVIVLRTENPDGSWLETRLWIVDEGGFPWLHGGASAWMANLRARPVVEVQRSGETHRYRAVPAPGPHPAIHQRLREKYGLADRWVRFLGPDRETTTAVRLEPLEAPSAAPARRLERLRRSVS